jgi:hypothetical protein
MKKAIMKLDTIVGRAILAMSPLVFFEKVVNTDILQPPKLFYPDSMVRCHMLSILLYKIRGFGVIVLRMLL